MTKELLKQARDALAYHADQTRPINNTDDAIAALDRALAQPDDTGEHIAHSLAGFRGGFMSLHKRPPTEQEIWNHAIRSWRDLNPAAQP